MKGCRVRGVLHFDKPHSGLACVNSTACGGCVMPDDEAPCMYQINRPLPEVAAPAPRRMVKPLPLPKRIPLEIAWAKGWPK